MCRRGPAARISSVAPGNCSGTYWDSDIAGLVTASRTRIPSIGTTVGASGFSIQNTFRQAIHWGFSERHLHRRLHPASDRLIAEQSLERLHREPTESFTLASEPLLEGRLVYSKPFEQVAPVEPHRITEGVRASVPYERLELEGVDRLRDQRDRLARRRERRGFDASECLPEMPQGLPEALP